MTDLNVEMIQKAIETKTEIIVFPRRAHTLKGIPLRFDSDILRLYIDTGRYVESILISEVGLFTFPKELYDSNFVPTTTIQDKVKEKQDYGQHPCLYCGEKIPLELNFCSLPRNCEVNYNKHKKPKQKAE